MNSGEYMYRAVVQPLCEEIARLHEALAAERDARAEWQALAADECASRRAAQIENEALKVARNRAGIEQRRAVLEEREACAKTCEEFGAKKRLAMYLAAAIRERKQA